MYFNNKKLYIAILSGIRIRKHHQTSTLMNKKNIPQMRMDNLNKAEHLAFHTDSLSYLVQSEILQQAELRERLTPLVEQYCGAINIERRILHPQRMSNLTPEIQQADKVRSRCFMFLNKMADTMTSSVVAHEVEAAKVLTFALKPFTGTSRRPRKQKTAALNKLLSVLKEEKNALIIKTLHLEEVVTQMEAENRLFAELERSRTSKSPDKLCTAENRKCTDSIYNQIIMYINAQNILAPTEKLSTFVSDIKNLIKKTREYRKLRGNKSNYKPLKQQIMEKIQDLGTSKFNLSEHVAFHTDALAFMKKCTAEKISATELEPLYEGAISTEQSLLHNQQASKLTAPLDAKDVKRSKLFSYIVASIDTALNSPIDAEVAANTALEIVIKPFRGANTSPNKQQSIEIDEFVKVLSQTENMAHITTLRLDNVLASLDAENKDYMELERQRTASTPDKNETNAHRAVTDGLYTQIIDRANATVILSTNAQAEQFVSDMNKLIKKTNDYNKLRQSDKEEE